MGCRMCDNLNHESQSAHHGFFRSQICLMDIFFGIMILNPNRTKASRGTRLSLQSCHPAEGIVCMTIVTLTWPRVVYFPPRDCGRFKSVVNLENKHGRCIGLNLSLLKISKTYLKCCESWYVVAQNHPFCFHVAPWCVQPIPGACLRGGRLQRLLRGRGKCHLVGMLRKGKLVNGNYPYPGRGAITCHVRYT